MPEEGTAEALFIDLKDLVAAPKSALNPTCRTSWRDDPRRPHSGQLMVPLSAQLKGFGQGVCDGNPDAGIGSIHPSGLQGAG